MVRFMDITTSKVSPINCEILDKNLEQLWEQHKLRLQGQQMPIADQTIKNMSEAIMEDSRKL